jgi:hypothetical protein
LVPPEANPENINKKGKSSKKGFSVDTTSASGQLPDSTLDTPAILSSKLPLSSVEVSEMIDFEEFHVEYSTFETELKEENIDIFSSHDIEKCFSIDNFEDFPTLGFGTLMQTRSHLSPRRVSSPDLLLTGSISNPLSTEPKRLLRFLLLESFAKTRPSPQVLSHFLTASTFTVVVPDLNIGVRGFVNPVVTNLCPHESPISDYQ